MVEPKVSNEGVSAPSQYSDPIYEKFKGVLKGAEYVLQINFSNFQGQVVTRFPPEPSGYLHIGHAKAAMLNFHYAKMYGGSMILRFDDTNPMNEKIEFVENIIRDLKTLEITPDRVTHTSDYFDQIKGYMEELIKKGLAYADDTPAEQMKKERDEGIESRYRNATVEENLKRFNLMLIGKHDEEAPKEEEKKGADKKGGQKKGGNQGGNKGKKEEKPKEEQKDTAPEQPKADWCMRAKMDMQSNIKCLRDPVFYRIKLQPHHRTGQKYKAYPTYDFACPIVDSLEGVSHAMRTIEYHDRDSMYSWVQDQLGLRKVEIYEYSRLSMVSTILSKRNLKWFVEKGIADGWYDPRFPTVQGIMRRGMTVQALKQFMLEQGPSKNNNLQEWDKIWAINKDVIDPIAPRYTAIDKNSACKLIIENGPEELEAQSQPLHPKNPAVGSKAVLYGKEVFIEKEDASSIVEGEKVTLMKWGNVTISKKEEGENGQITLTGKVDPADKDFKKTKKLTWVTSDPAVTITIKVVEFDHLISKKKMEDNDKIEDCVNANSRVEYSLIGEGCMRNLQKGDILQLERRGYFFVDDITFGDRELTFNFIPDGKSKSMSKVNTKLDAKETAKGKGQGAQFANKAQAKAAGGQQQPAEEGGEQKLSKKQQKKLANKEKKKKGKEGEQAPPEGEAPKDDK